MLCLFDLARPTQKHFDVFLPPNFYLPSPKPKSSGTPWMDPHLLVEK